MKRATIGRHEPNRQGEGAALAELPLPLRRLGVALAVLLLPLSGHPPLAAAQEALPRAERSVLVLPFEVHAPDAPADLGVEAATRLAELLDERSELSARVAGADELPPEGISGASDISLRTLGARLGVAAVVAGSWTELAGRASLDVRVVPSVSAVETPASSQSLTAPQRSAMFARLGEVASDVAEKVAGVRPDPVRSVAIVGAAELEEELSERVGIAPGDPYSAQAARAAVERLEAHPSVASVSVESERGPAGVDLRFRIVRSELIFGAGAPGESGEQVEEVRVRGNRRIDSDAIRSRVQTRPGEPLRPGQISSDVRAVFGLGFFSDVRVFVEEGIEGPIVTFEVEENPVVRQIAVTGNDSIEGDKLRDSLTLTTGSTLDLPLLHENTQRIEALYRAEGYYLAEVGYEIKPLAEGSVAVDFVITEGEKLKLRHIVFIGNEAFSSSELMEDFATRLWRFYSPVTSWLDKSGTYSEPVFLRDLRSIEKLYTDHGYLQVEVEEPDVEPSEDGLVVSVRIIEGPQFQVGEIDVAGDQTVDIEVLRKRLKLKQGEIFNRSHLTEDVESLESYYTDRGFYFANVQPATRLDPEARTVDVEFQVEKGPLYFIRHVEIAGNTRTIDPVIRRELQAVEGQLYSARAIQVSSRRIRGMGFFEDVSFEPRQTEDPSLLDLELNVVERPTGSFSFGAGFSSQDSFVFTASLSEQNLFGRGYGANVTADIGGRTSRYFISLTDPYFLGSTFSFSTTLFRTEVNFQDFQQKQQGMSVGLGHSLAEDNTSRGSLRYSFSQQDISQDSGVNASSVIFRELLQGNESSSTISLSFVTDTRDDRFAPTRGVEYGANLDYAGLGGFANFLRMEGRFRWYLGAPRWLLRRSTFVFSTRIGYAIPFNSIGDWKFNEVSPISPCDELECVNVGEIDTIDDDLKLPLSERYFLGGIGSFQLRGYEARSVGPRRAILKRSGLVGTGNLFSPVGTQLSVDQSSGKLVARCNDVIDPTVGNPNQGNGNGKCNDIDDKDIDDFDDLDETDVIGGNKFIASSFEYRFPISEEVGLQGVVFVDGGNAYAEGDQMFDATDWRYGYGGGVLWFSPFGPLQLVLGFPIDPLPDEKSPVFEFSVGGFGL